MTENYMVKLFEHNHWANQLILQTCLTLSDQQLDAEPQSVTKGSIRQTLIHMVSAQNSYLMTLTLPVEVRMQPVTVDFDKLVESERMSAEGLLPLAAGEKQPFGSKVQTRQGYLVDSWAIMVQIINHATEHREQICSMLNVLGVTPPGMDGWSYAEAMKALVPVSK
jgi:uncharacterized damage-inducible protein DinB